jgi:hypothetical protein
MVKINTLPIMDYHQKHINHFTTKTLISLLNRYNFSPTKIDQYITKPHEYPSIRVIFEHINGESIYNKAMNWCQSNIEAKIEKAKQIKGKVIVWGCGDICLLILNEVPLDVAHYVDLDPAYRNQTIQGVPVLDHVEGNYPIVVIAQMQKESVLESIRKLGIQNRIITI